MKLLGSEKDDKVFNVFKLVQESYVDSVNIDSIRELTIAELLQNLDPHSSYLNPQDAKRFEEDMDGNYQGIGVEYQIIKDTLLVTQLSAASPASRAGVKLGDKVVQIDGYNIAGVGITSKKLQEMIRGRKGSPVNLAVFRSGSHVPLNIKVNRDIIEVSTVDVAYMLQPTIGYLKLNKFGAKTDDDFIEAVSNLKKQGMASLVLDLRDNGGGYLKSAIGVAEQFLGEKSLIVYTQGLHEPRADFYASANGVFKQGKLVVLIDENTASASEVVAGAVQDQDRGIIIGRRSFGKGLVQEQFNFGDGSTLNLTVARYYTPSGRSIQKPYKNGIGQYFAEVDNRLKSGEITNMNTHMADSLFKNSKSYRTHNGRVIYGGGGIMPDIYVPLDTAGHGKMFVKLYNDGVISDFLYNYLVKKNVFDSLSHLVDSFNMDANQLAILSAFAEKRGIKYPVDSWNKARRQLNTEIKALYARYQFGDEGYYRVLNLDDQAINKSLEVLREP